MKVILIESPELSYNEKAALRRAVSEGRAVCVYPEFTVNNAAGAAEFKIDIMGLCRELKTDIITVRIEGMKNSFFSRSVDCVKAGGRVRLFRKANLVFGPVIKAAVINDKGAYEKVIKFYNDSSYD